MYVSYSKFKIACHVEETFLLLGIKEAVIWTVDTKVFVKTEDKEQLELSATDGWTSDQIETAVLNWLSK